MLIRAVRMDPGEQAVEVFIEPKTEVLERLVGGSFYVDIPRHNGIAIIGRKIPADEIVRANRQAIESHGIRMGIYHGVILAVGCDLITSEFRSLTDREFGQVMRDYKKPHFPTYKHYGLVPGEELGVDGRIFPDQRSFPERVEVIKEYPYHIECRASFKRGDEIWGFNFSINKASLIDHYGSKADQIRVWRRSGKDKWTELNWKEE